MTGKNQSSPWLDDKLNAAKTSAERDEILRQWDEAKMERARVKEEERINAPSLMDKIYNFFAARRRVK